ncbi:MAG TPA: peptide ABC transporter substrate-binding protein, partial [Rhodospirillales bacterium]
MKRLLRLFALALLVSAAAPAGAKDTLVIGITQFPATLHPDIDEMAAKSYVLGATRRPFTTYDPDWKLTCMLCVELPTLENGGARLETTPDGKHGMAVTYRIQPGARWGDGVPLTSADVVFTWQAGRHPKSGFSGEEFYRRVYKVDALDAKTFTLHVDKVFFDYNALEGFQVLPAHLEAKIFAERPEEYRTRTLYVTEPANRGLYFGPYRIAQVVPGSHIVLEQNETWWGAAPYFKRVTVRAIENTAALEANLLSSAIDMIDGDLGLALDEALAFEKRHGARYNIVYKPGLIYEHIDLNLSNPILADARVRQALVLGIDRAGISEKLFGGRQPVAHTSVNALDWIHTVNTDKYPFDPRRAAQLLAEAG